MIDADSALALQHISRLYQKDRAEKAPNERLKYILEGHVLGRGSFGRVYSVVGYPHLAVKRIQIGLTEADKMNMASPGSSLFDDDLAATINEKRAFAIVKCVSLVRFYGSAYGYSESGKTPTYVYLIMERCYCSLEDMINNSNRLHMPADQMLCHCVCLLEGLQVLHTERPYLYGQPREVGNIVHGDIKPANILVRMTHQGPFLVFADFNLSKTPLYELEKGRGTEIYRAPEVKDRKDINVASDVYSLGATLLELLFFGTTDFSISHDFIKWRQQFEKRNADTGYYDNLQTVDSFLMKLIKSSLADYKRYAPIAKAINFLMCSNKDIRSNQAILKVMSEHLIPKMFLDEYSILRTLKRPIGKIPDFSHHHFVVQDKEKAARVVDVKISEATALEVLKTLDSLCKNTDAFSSTTLGAVGSYLKPNIPAHIDDLRYAIENALQDPV